MERILVISTVALLLVAAFATLTDRAEDAEAATMEATPAAADSPPMPMPAG